MINIESKLYKYGSLNDIVTLEFNSNDDVLQYIEASRELTEYNAQMSELQEENCHSKYWERFTYNGTDYHLEVDC